MTRHFHGALNRMAFFTAFIAALLILFYPLFMQIAISNIWLNGIIIGTTLFGVGACFAEIFRLIPEYKWLSGFTHGKRIKKLPPRLLRPVAVMLTARPKQISATTLNGMLEMILLRMDDSRESTRYITNTLIFLGLLGTFWGLVLTVGGFAELISGLNFSDETVLQSMQIGLSRPLAGMATAFTSSLLGLGGSLSVGFLSLQVQSAQNAIYHNLEDYLSAHTHVAASDDVTKILPQINLTTRELTRSVQNIEQQFSDI